VDCSETFEGYHPIYICNFIYKIIAKVLVARINPLLSNFILAEKIDFLEGRQIHEARGTTHEDFHSIILSKYPIVVIDLSKAYDRVFWIYLRLLLIHIGFSYPII